MRIVVDSREQAPFAFRGPRYDGVIVRECHADRG